MSEVKIYGIETVSDPETLNKVFAGATISEKKLNGSGDSNYLPESGKFIGFVLQGENTMQHIVMISEPAGHCSLSSLQAQAVFGVAKDRVEFEESKRADLKVMLFPKGSKKLNTQIPSAQKVAVNLLVGKSFKATEQDGIIQDFVADPKTGKPVWETTQAKAKARLIAKKFYKLELL